jgi:hypothetical protein
MATSKRLLSLVWALLLSDPLSEGSLNTAMNPYILPFPLPISTSAPECIICGEHYRAISIEILRIFFCWICWTGFLQKFYQQYLGRKEI